MIDPIQVEARSTARNDPYSVIRVLRWYEKSGDRLVSEASLSSIKLPELQALFRKSVENPMVDCYPVSIVQVDRLQKEIHEPTNLSAYDYYVECDVA